MVCEPVTTLHLNTSPLYSVMVKEGMMQPYSHVSTDTAMLPYMRREEDFDDNTSSSSNSPAVYVQTEARTKKKWFSVRRQRAKE